MLSSRMQASVIGYFVSAVLHGLAILGLAWTVVESGPDFSTLSSESAGEITAAFSAPQPADESDSDAPPVEMTVAQSEPVTPLSPMDQHPVPTVVKPVRQRQPRTIALAGMTLPVVPDAADSETVENSPRPEMPPICEEFWRQTAQLPRQVDFESLAKLLERAKSAAPAIAAIDGPVVSVAQQQGTKVDALPRPGPKNPPPVYPAQARANRQTGLVVLTVTVGVNGSVTAIQIGKSSGVVALDDAALAAVRLWTFEPARRNGIAVELEIDVPIRFRLTN